MNKRRQIVLGIHFPGVNNTTVWSDPRSGSQIEFESFSYLARVAEKAKFDFFFLAEGLRLREQHGLIYDLDVVGRPDNITVLTALAAVTNHIGLAATVNSTFNEPYDIARQFVTLNHLCGGRAAWNVVTSWDAFTGENFRAGGYLPESLRYNRAQEFLDAVLNLCDSWRADDIIADKITGKFVRRDDAGKYSYNSQQFSISGRFQVPSSPAGRPVIFQAGDSIQGREFAAAQADAIFSRHSDIEAGKIFYQDVKSRLKNYGRDQDSLLIVPAVSFILADTDSEAVELSRSVARQQHSGATAIKLLEQLWNTDLSSYDPDGPLPDFDPIISERHIAQGRASVRRHEDIIKTARSWHTLAIEKNLSIRELIIEVYARYSFVGSAKTIAKQLINNFEQRACDGFIIVPHIIPGGLDEFATQVVPILQEKGYFRSEYTGMTLRENLGLDPC